MPQHASCKKRLRQDEKRRLRNKGIRSDMKSAMKKVELAEDTDTATGAARVAISKVDKALKRGVIKKNSAARKKSSIMRRAAQAGTR